MYVEKVKLLKKHLSVQNDESQRGHCTDERRVRKRVKKVRRDVIYEDDSRRWTERGGSSDV